MTIDNYCSGDDRYDSFSVSHAEAHSRVALAQSALFAAQVAISRWASAGGAGQPAPVMAQADWYAAAQEDFQQWLERGGFAQYADECPNMITPTMFLLNTACVQPVRSDIRSASA